MRTFLVEFYWKLEAALGSEKVEAYTVIDALAKARQRAIECKANRFTLYEKIVDVSMS